MPGDMRGQNRRSSEVIRLLHRIALSLLLPQLLKTANGSEYAARMKPGIPDYGWITYGERGKILHDSLSVITHPECRSF